MFQLIALDIVFLFTHVKLLKKLQKLVGKVLVALGAFFALEPSNWTPYKAKVEISFQLWS